MVKARRYDIWQVQKEVSVLNKMNKSPEQKMFIRKLRTAWGKQDRIPFCWKMRSSETFVGGGRKKTTTLSRRPDTQSLSLCSLQKNGWSKDLYVGESLARSIMTCLFSVLPLEYLAILFFYLKRKNKRKSKLIVVRWPAESSYSSPRLIIWAVIVLFDIICICQDLQLLNMAIIFNHLQNIYLSQLTLAISWRTFLTQPLDAQKAISTAQCMSNLIFE